MRVSEEIIVLQQNFRTLLRAMSHPGKVYLLEDFDVDPLMSVIQTLVDQEVTFCVVGENARLLQLIHESTRSPLAEIGAADFIIVPEGGSFGEICKAKRGTPEYPDLGATIICQVGSLGGEGNGKPHVVLTGPGIETEIRPAAVQGLMQSAFHDLSVVNAGFPLGVDCIFVDNIYRIMAIPRSTRIRVIG
jgi:alpha-D-ribose 1-methylphosphonate 5-triphosphate synthase subunit PhnH